MKKIIAAILALTMLASAFASCDSAEKQTEASESNSIESTAVQTEARTEETTLAETESETETETETETEAPIEPAMPEGDPDLVYTTADGYVMSQYNNMEMTDYIAAVKACEELNKLPVYSKFSLGSLHSSVYAASGYFSVTYNGAKKELYIGNGADDAILPARGEYGDKICDITITQRHSSEINGMTYIIRLTDGSFIVIDGGYKEEAQTLYDTLCDLNGSEKNIHIRAWMITHSHGDHYQAFNQFSLTHASKVKLDYLICSPVSGAKNQDNYLNNQVKTDLARFSGAKLCGVHTGMVFDFNGLRWEMLATPEHIYKENAPDDFNETSIVSRLVNEDGSIIFLGDSGIHVANWMIDTYGDALKSDMVQMAHHGAETAPAELYDKIRAATCFWPSSESLFVSYRGELVKQHVIEAEYSKEHLLHGYGTITRPLSYKTEGPEYYSIFPKSAGQLTGSNYTKRVRIEDGVLKYEVVSVGGKLDPYVYYTLKNVDTEQYNAIRIVVDSACAEKSSIYFTCGKDQAIKFTAAKANGFGPAGASDDGTTTLIGYLGDVEDYYSRLTSIRLDFGNEDGQTVSIYSVELFYVDVN